MYSPPGPPPVVIKVDDLHIRFPYNPYPEQIKYIEAVVKACQSSTNAMLESPTGTGKTLSLLCASLSWLHHKRQTCTDVNYPRVIYLSRTHSQLIQVVKELKKTQYMPFTITLGSRDLLCINPNANTRQGTHLNMTCKKLRRGNQCPFAHGRTYKVSELKTNIMDIEDLLAFGQKHQVCPFYATREMLIHADLLLMPYNYLLDSKVSSAHKNIQYTNSIIIFDEAHNIQKAAEDASSFQVSVSDLKKCIEEVRQIQKVKQSIEQGETLYDDVKKEVGEISDAALRYIEYPVANFLAYLQNFSDMSPQGITYEGRMLYDIFIHGTASRDLDEAKDKSEDKDEGRRMRARRWGAENATYGGRIRGKGKKKADCDQYPVCSDNLTPTGISAENSYKYSSLITKVVEAMAPRNGGVHLEMWKKVVDTVYSYMTQDSGTAVEGELIDTVPRPAKNIDDYKVIICDDVDEYESDQQPKKDLMLADTGHRNPDTRCFKAYCFNPGIALFELIKAKPRTVILTSGTLSPMDSLERELRMPFPIKLETGHVIGKNQVYVQIVTKDQQREDFNFNYHNRGKSEQMKRLGHLVRDICMVTPGGVLVFFSAYTMLHQCWEMWSGDIIPEIASKWKKKVFKEHKTSVQNQHVLDKYRDAITSGKGAVMMAVCRGKIGEGLDFSDDAARAALVVGIPFPALTDRKVNLKKEYLDQRIQQLKMSGSSWYLQEGMRAVNQSIGRVIRHINDYGSIILVDHRFTTEGHKIYLSKWLRDGVTSTDKCEECVAGLRQFFAQMKTWSFPAIPDPAKHKAEKEKAKKKELEKARLRKKMLKFKRLPSEKKLEDYFASIPRKVLISGKVASPAGENSEEALRPEPVPVCTKHVVVEPAASAPAMEEEQGKARPDSEPAEDLAEVFARDSVKGANGPGVLRKISILIGRDERADYDRRLNALMKTWRVKGTA